jgi:hypothetical protein
MGKERLSLRSHARRFAARQYLIRNRHVFGIPDQEQRRVEQLRIGTIGRAVG